MAGKVIQTLRLSLLATVLSEAELRLLANCGRILTVGRGETILDVSGLDERFFLLREGRLSLHLVVWTESGQCGGEAILELASPAEPSGWAAWMRQDFLAVSAFAIEPVSLVAFDLQSLGDTQTFMKVSQRMLQILYGILQEHGLCPPNIQAWLRMKRHLLAGEYHESGMG
jgi:CRP-like cAMP-binding protein